MYEIQNLERLFPGSRKEFKVPFAYDENKVLHDQLSAQKDKDYICQCGAIVRLRAGEKRRLHFYHVSDTQCTGEETIIHKAYKQVFSEIACIRTQDGLFRYHKIDIEKKIDAGSDWIIADAIGYIGETMHIIEFANTSKIKQKKLDKLRRINLLTIEVLIDSQPQTLNEIRDHIENKLHHKSIVCRPDDHIDEIVRSKIQEESQHLFRVIDDLKSEVLRLEEKNKELNNRLLAQDLAFSYRESKYEKSTIEDDLWFFQKTSSSGTIYYQSSDSRYVIFSSNAGKLILKKSNRMKYQS